MCLDEALGDGHPEPGATITWGAGRVASVSKIEDVVEVGFGDASAGIHDRDDRKAGVGLDASLDAHRAAGWRVADGVVEEVAEDAAHLGSRQLDNRRRLPDRPAEIDALRARRDGRAGERLRYQLVERYPLEIEPEGTGLDTRQLEQVVDQPGKAVGLLTHRPLVAGYRLRIVDDAILECLDHGPDPSERRAQIVRHPRDQFAAAALQGDPLVLGLRQADRP